MTFRSAQHILFCLRYGIGDLIMQTPALEALRAASTEARIHALGARPAIELLEDDPRIDRLSCVQDWGLRHWGDAGTGEIELRLRRWLEKQAFDLILDPSHAVLAVRDAVWKSHARILDAWGSAEEQALAAGQGGIAAMKSAVRQAWGLAIPGEAGPRLHVRAEDFAFADRFLAGLSAANPRVSLSAAASSPLKQWPLYRLAATADLLVERFDADILFFCAMPEDTAEFLAAVQQPKRVIIAAGLHLKRVAALLSRSDLLVCNDTGLMHMGAALRLPLVAVFGPTSPAVYFPAGTGSRALGGHFPCGYRKTTRFGPPECLLRRECLQGHRSCIDEVAFDEMVEAIQCSPVASRLGSSAGLFSSREPTRPQREN